MNIILKTAWKNIWRNKVRSLVVISSVTVGIFAGSYSVGLMNGMINQRINDAVNEEISGIQITKRNYRINNDPGLTIDDVRQTESVIGNMEGIAGISSRTIITGMANSAYKSTGVQITGINPDNEKKVFSLYKKIIPGTGGYFDKSSRLNPVLIGEDLGKDLGLVRYRIDSSVISRLREKKIPENTLSKLTRFIGVRFTGEKQFIKKMNSVITGKEARVYGPVIRKEAWSFREGSKITLTFLDCHDQQVNAVFSITGIYDISNTVYEKTTLFVRQSDLLSLTGYPENSCNIITVKLIDLNKPETILKNMAARLPGLEVISWKKLQPDLGMMTDLVQQFYLVFGIIILAALAFGIVNTMLMAVLERTRELGMLTAIGMNKRRVFSMIMLESVFLSLAGGITGMIISYALIRLTAGTGINLSQYAEGFEAIGYSAHIYPQIDASFFFFVTILIIITGILSSVYPALKALKLDPAEAIRTE